jgi:hypothetical protein
VNRDIIILRETVVKLTQLLTNMGLKVTQQGSNAFVEVDHRTQKPKRINIPHIPDNATTELLLAIQGFVDHEVGHVLFTDWKVVKRSNERGEAFNTLRNIVEDPFVERKMGERFPGAVYNVKQLHAYFIEGITKPALKEAGGDSAKQFAILLVPLVRSLSGQVIFQKFMKDYEKHPLVKALLEALPADIKARLPKVQSTQESFDIASVIHDIIYPPKPPATPAADDSKDEEPSKSDEPSKSEKSSKSSASEDEGDESEGEAGSSGDEEDGDADEDESSGDEEDGEDTDDDEAGDKETGSSGDEEDGEDDDDSGHDASDGDDAEKGSDRGASKAAGDEEAGENTDENESPSDTSKLIDGDESGKGSDPVNPFATTGVPVVPDFEASLAEKIGKDMIEASKESDYVIFTKDYDVIERFPSKNCSDEMLTRLDDETRHMVGLMQKDIERMMAARSQVVQVPGYRSGRLHSAGLHRLMANDDRVFRRRHEARSKDTVVGLLIDNSGSMSHSNKISVAMSCGYALSQTLDRVGIKHEVLGFTTSRSYGLPSQVVQAEEKKIGRRFSRFEALYMPIFKDFNERVTPEIKRRFAGAAYNHDGMANNLDGESVEIAVMRLARRSEKRKILMVLSDGQPHAAGNIMEQNTKLRSVIKEAPMFGIDLIGIGIMDASVRAYYPRHVVLPALADLPKTVMGEVKKILSAT